MLIPSLYSNPASDLITLQDDAEIISSRLFDVAGNLVEIFNGTNYSLNHLKSGVYYLSVSTDKGIVQHKFVKQ